MRLQPGNTAFLFRIAGVGLFVAVWFLAGTFGGSGTSLYIASPQETLVSLISLIRNEQLIRDIVATSLRTLTAFIPEVLFGVAAGLLLGFSRRLRYLCEIPIEFFRSLPATALLPIFILALGINDLARIGVVFFIGFWVVLINTIYGVMHSSEIRRNVALSMRANRNQIFLYVTVWEVLPYIFSGMRLAISISLVIVLIAEMVIGPDYGLGIRLLNAQQTFRVNDAYAIMVVTGALGFLLNRMIIKSEKKIVHWKTI